jgi:hypothetical protein
MNSPAKRALVVALVVAGFLGLLHALGIGLKLLLALALLLSFVCLLLPRLGLRWFDATVLWLRGLYWAREEGRFHSFGGVPLEIEDDGRHVWVDGHGLQRALGRDEPEATLAARHSGRWRRRSDERLMLRVDAVVSWLNTMPEREDPRVQRLRHYFERQVLYPAEQRLQRRS